MRGLSNGAIWNSLLVFLAGSYAFLRFQIANDPPLIIHNCAPQQVQDMITHSYLLQALTPLSPLPPSPPPPRDGRLKRNDQIIRINGRSLEGLLHSEAIKILQSTQGIVEIVVLRNLNPDPPAPNPDVPLKGPWDNSYGGVDISSKSPHPPPPSPPNLSSSPPSASPPPPPSLLHPYPPPPSQNQEGLVSSSFWLPVNKVGGEEKKSFFNFQKKKVKISPSVIALYIKSA